MSERTTRKERTDIWATVAGAVIAVLFVAVRVLELVRAEGVPSTVGRIAGPNAVDEGSGVVADVLSPVTAGLLWSAVVVELLVYACGGLGMTFDGTPNMVLGLVPSPRAAVRTFDMMTSRRSSSTAMALEG